ncbi:acyltransferase domain-containing protein [Burkholderia sp. GS2Y]|uniref:Acyltransferase domain-containing protein n=1 Tax=Burkholderia theae TaxID=3143496 RepID=A0ABU9WBH3_9BURK
MTSSGFVFVGSGGQYPGMAANLYKREPSFRSAFDECCHFLDAWLPAPLSETLFEKGTDDDLSTIEYMSTTLFATQYALVAYWQSRGIVPNAVLAHSMGAHAAACAAGALTCEEACALLELRCRLVPEKCKPGAMGVAEVTLAEVLGLVRQSGFHVEIAAINAIRWVTFAGTREAVKGFVHFAERAGVKARAHPISHAFHSSLMDSVLPDYEVALKTIPSRRPMIPFYTTSRRQVEILDGRFWCGQLRDPMDFAPSFLAFARSFTELALEIGPSDVFSRFAREAMPTATALPSLSREKCDIETSTLEFLQSRDLGSVV